MTQDTQRAVIARQTAELVTAYCQTLEIGPADLPELIAYVGAVLSRSHAGRPAVPASGLLLADLFPPAQVICLEQYRAAQKLQMPEAV